MVKMSDSAHGIVIAIEETPAPSLSIAAPEDHGVPDATNGKSFVPTITLSSPPQADVVDGLTSPGTRARTPSPVVLTQVCVPVEQSSSPVLTTAGGLPKSPSCSQSPSPPQPEGSSKSRASSPTLVRKGSNASTRTATYSPVMRSIFPRYDPNMSLARQQYYPQAQNGGASPAPFGDVYSPSPCSQQGRQGSGLALPVLDIPPPPAGSAPVLQQVMHARRSSALSTPEELLQLWSIANGQAVRDVEDTYSVELSW